MTKGILRYYLIITKQNSHYLSIHAQFPPPFHHLILSFKHAIFRTFSNGNLWLLQVLDILFHLVSHMASHHLLLDANFLLWEVGDEFPCLSFHWIHSFVLCFSYEL